MRMLRRVARGMPLRVSGSVGGSLERLKAAEDTRPSNAEGGADGARNPEGIPGEPGGASRVGGQDAHAFATPLWHKGFRRWGLLIRGILMEVGCKWVVGLKQEPGLE